MFLAQSPTHKGKQIPTQIPQVAAVAIATFTGTNTLTRPSAINTLCVPSKAVAKVKIDACASSNTANNVRASTSTATATVAVINNTNTASAVPSKAFKT